MTTTTIDDNGGDAYVGNYDNEDCSDQCDRATRNNLQIDSEMRGYQGQLALCT